MSNNVIISEKLNSLMQDIHGQYGTLLTNELIARLKETIADFNDEVDALMNELKENAALKEKLMADIKLGKAEETSVEPNADSADEIKDVSEWEKRLEKLR